MRVLITADVHFNHPRSRALAEDLIGQMNRAGGDVLLLAGDTSTTMGESLEHCLSRFTLPHTKKLIIAGNHELWTLGGDSYELYTRELPNRVRAMEWQWLEDEPFVSESFAIVGSVGWYDYSFAQASLGIPRRFYERKLSPGAASRLSELGQLFEPSDDIPASAMEVFARWNDGRYVKLHRSDEQFLNELLARLRAQLSSLAQLPTIVAAIHHLPFRELLPPPHSAQWDFAKAYLGSDRIGQMLLEFKNVQRVFCGHSHLAADAKIGQIHAVNIGSGYRHKNFHTLDLPD